MAKNKNKDDFSSNTNTNGLSEDDFRNLDLLSIQKFAILLNIYSDILSYKVTLEGFDLINNKESITTDEQQELTIKIDKEVIEALRFTIASRSLLTYVALTRYNIVYDRKLNGDFQYSLEANELINVGIILRLLGDVISLQAAYEILERDGDSVFGI